MICVRNSPFLLCPLWDFFLAQSHSFAGFREERPSRKETTHAMMNNDGKQHREVNNNMKNIGWEKKVEREVVYFGISRLLANVAFG